MSVVERDFRVMVPAWRLAVPGLCMALAGFGLVLPAQRPAQAQAVTGAMITPPFMYCRRQSGGESLDTN